MYKPTENLPDTIAGLVIVKTYSRWIFLKKIKTRCKLQVASGFGNLNFVRFGFGNGKPVAGGAHWHP